MSLFQILDSSGDDLGILSSNDDEDEITNMAEEFCKGTNEFYNPVNEGDDRDLLDRFIEYCKKNGAMTYERAYIDSEIHLE